MSEPWWPYSRSRRAEPGSDAPALVSEQLAVRYPGTDRWALRGVSLRLDSGSRLALVGTNGAGKSTLLKAVAGLLPIAAGDIRVFGQPVGACRRRLAYLPQRGEIDWSFPITVSRLVLTGRYVHLGWFRRPSPHDYHLVAMVLERLGVADLAEQQIGQLSGGQQQRTLLARALVQEADLLLLDEPFNAVDAPTREVIYAVLADLKAQGKTVVVTTHDLERLADAYDATIHLQDGAVVEGSQDPLAPTSTHTLAPGWPA
jgi:ABC-type Mn2+/Zn2+ transport system ATPase subunit